MTFKPTFVRETFLTNLTLVGVLMSPSMIAQTNPLCKSFVTILTLVY